MSEEPEDPIADASGDALRQEASEWFVRMRGADAEHYRSEFEAWLRRGALHRAAYNSVAATFAIGKKVRREDLADEIGTVRVHSARTRWALLGGIVALLLAAVSAGWLFHAHFAGRSRPYADVAVDFH
jgi:transmembrane sensor